MFSFLGNVIQKRASQKREELTCMPAHLASCLKNDISLNLTLTTSYHSYFKEEEKAGAEKLT